MSANIIQAMLLREEPVYRVRLMRENETYKWFADIEPAREYARANQEKIEKVTYKITVESVDAV